MAEPTTSAPMALLTTVPGSFPAKVIAARLGAEGIVWELRGNVDGPYPGGAVQVLVPSAELREAQELLLADEIDALDARFDGDDDDDDEAASDADPESALPAPLALWLVLGAIVTASVLNLTRLVFGS